ncbi:MAG: S8 family serine peptidase [Planctomycetia bacterium]|nr:S8 family serine peptidase [Planctomycetia bacterium]
MSLHNWLRNFRSPMAPHRGRRDHVRRGSRMVVKLRPGVECLEDRSLPSISPVMILPEGPLQPGASRTEMFVHEEKSYEYDTSRILVRFRPDVSVLTGMNFFDGATIGRELPMVSGLHEVRLAPGVEVEDALATFRNNPLVQYAQPNFRIQAQVTPNDPSFSSLWGMNNTGQTGGTPGADIDAPEVWNHWTGNGSTIVAVIDTGVDYTHPDLVDNMWTNTGEIPDDGLDNDSNGIIDDYYGANFVYRDEFYNPTGDPLDDHFHGTHVAGTIGAVGNNGIGVAGVSWNVKIMAVKFLDYWGYGYTSDAIDALNYAVSMGAMISNNSWGGGPYDQGLYDAIQSAGLQGHLFIAAAGNYGEDADESPMYPAAYDLDNIISVAATDHNDQLAYFSNYGANSVDLGAPGVNIYSTFPTYLTDAMWDYGLETEYGAISGTSMATPHVAGVASLLRDLHPDWSPLQIKDQLLLTTDSLFSLNGNTVSGGRLNANSAVTGTVSSRLRIADSSVLEGNTGTNELVFEVTLTTPSNDVITVNYSTSNGTALAGSDYQTQSGTLTFAPGEMSKFITVHVNGDRIAEQNETLLVTLSQATNAGIADGLGVGTIVDNEPRISISDVSLNEGGNKQTTVFTFVVTLSAAYDQPVTVSFRTANGTASQGSDYTARSGSLTFAPNETSKSITISVKGDNKREADELFYLDLFGNSSNSVIVRNRGIGTILNDD